MATEMEVYGGQNGYVPVKDNSHGGVDLGRATNGLRVMWYNEIAEEFGYVQIANVASAGWDKSSTGEYWVEKSHLKVVPVAVGEKYQLLNVDYSVVPPVVTLKKV